jgi:hypothetical protein
MAQYRETDDCQLGDVYGRVSVAFYSSNPTHHHVPPGFEEGIAGQVGGIQSSQPGNQTCGTGFTQIGGREIVEHLREELRAKVLQS